MKSNVVGHVPQDISRFVYFFLHHGGSIDTVVEDEKYRPSPIAKGGLEIVLRATFQIDDSKRSLLHRLKNLLKRTTSFFTNQLQMKKNQLLVTMERICQLCS